MRLTTIVMTALMAGLTLFVSAQPRKVAVGGLHTTQNMKGVNRVQGISENQQLLGYIQTDSITVRGAAFGKAGTYTVGAILTSKMLAPYAGCHVVGIRLAAALDLGRTRTFIYSIDGSTLTPVIEQKQRIYEGWNNVFFNGNGYEIQGNEELFFGFDYVETSEMVDAELGGLCGYGEDTDGGFYAYGDFGKGLGLYQLSNIGSLCVQLIVDVSSLPMKDLDLMSLDAGFKYKQAGENIDVMVSCMNAGRQAVHGYQLGCQVDDLQPRFFSLSDSVGVGRSTYAIFSYSLPQQMEVGMHHISVFVSKVEGQDMPENSKNDTVTASFAIYQNMMSRSKVYMEIYTDQTSPYVPYLNTAIQQLVNTYSQLTVVNVHRPATPLAIDEAAYLHQFYAYTWPTFTFNRSYFPGEAYIAYDMNDYLPVIPSDMTAAILGDMILQESAMPTFASLSLQLSHQEDTHQLTIDATGELLPEAEAIYGDLALTLMITENKVKNRQAEYNQITGRTVTNQNYVHNQVLHRYVTSPIGDVVQTADGKFHAQYTVNLDDAWKPEDVNVVGILTKYVESVTEDNLLDVDVIDCNSVSIAQASAIQAVGIQEQETQAIFYSLDGKQMPAMQLKRGIVLKRMPDGTVRKVAIK